MNESYKYHECNRIPKDGIIIVYSNQFGLRSQPVWHLVIQRIATEDDLNENHYLEEVGEILWSTELEITHCPYCGEKLLDPKMTEIEDYGKFVHIDSTAWNSRRQ